MIIAFFFSAAEAKRESYYQKKWCLERGGQLEVVMSDDTRCDCLLDQYAVEVDFAKKWAEAIGQALHYSVLTGKCPGILLIIEKGEEYIVDRIQTLSNEKNLGITIWVIYKEEE